MRWGFGVITAAGATGCRAVERKNIVAFSCSSCSTPSALRWKFVLLPARAMAAGAAEDAFLH